MEFDAEKERHRLSQQELIASISQLPRMSEMLTIQSDGNFPVWGPRIYCALVPNSMVEESLANTSWDLLRGDGLPGTVSYMKAGQDVVDYLRFGSDDGIQPLVIYRSFHGVREPYYELSEEFRHFHDLYHDRADGRFLKFGESGEEDVIAHLEKNRVQVRLREIRQFLAIKDMHLAILFDCCVRSAATLKELALESGYSTHRNELLTYSVAYGEGRKTGDRRAFSRLLGKYLIPPLAKEKSGFYSFAEEEENEYVEFTIDVDEDGDGVTFTSNPNALGSNFSAVPNAPHYLTPVHFRRQVLDKYYQATDNYTVDTSRLRCCSLWSMSIDTDLEDRVVAWLGDLGRDLPYSEQLHWKQYNLPPDGTVSESYFRNQILNQNVSPENAEFQFQQAFVELASACDEHLGWGILRPFSEEDEHNFKSIRIPATDEQRQFDALVQSLTKVLVDCLNEREIAKLISPDHQTDKSGIYRLEAALRSRQVVGFEQHIEFLRNLQNLRSKGSAHRKGKDYPKALGRFAEDGQPLRSVYAGILQGAIELIGFLTEIVNSGSFCRSRQ